MATKLGISDRTTRIERSVIREVFSKVQALSEKGVEVANFSIGRPDFDTPQHIKDATKKALDEGRVHYVNTAGIASLRQAVCLRMREDYYLDIDPESVLITAGAAQANYIATQTILGDGDEVLVPEPMYTYYGGWAYLGGAKCVPFSLKEENQFSLNLTEIERHISKNTKAIILTSPHNPTGQVFEKNSLERVAELSKKHNFYVISDDIYNKLLYDNLEYFPIAKIEEMLERTIIIGSFSKTYAMDGWRIGYLIAPPEVIEGSLKMHQHIISCINTFVQAGAQEALIGSQECVEKMVVEFDRRRRLMLSYMDDIGISYVRPRGSFFVFPSIRQYGMSSEEFCDFALKEANVAIVPGTAFGNEGEGFVRFAYTVPCEIIDKGMQRLKLAMSKL